MLPRRTRSWDHQGQCPGRGLPVHLGEERQRHCANLLAEDAGTLERTPLSSSIPVRSGPSTTTVPSDAELERASRAQTTHDRRTPCRRCTNFTALPPHRLLLDRRRGIRADSPTWCRHCGYEPAAPHRRLIDRQAGSRRPRATSIALRVFMPPGSAKIDLMHLFCSPLVPGRAPKASHHRGLPHHASSRRNGVVASAT